jgi:hypothetical protein
VLSRLTGSTFLRFLLKLTFDICNLFLSRSTMSSCVRLCFLARGKRAKGLQKSCLQTEFGAKGAWRDAELTEQARAQGRAELSRGGEHTQAQRCSTKEEEG